MTTDEIATELAETLSSIRRRADICQQHAKEHERDTYRWARIQAKATAYGHAAELLEEVIERCGLRQGQP